MRTCEVRMNMMNLRVKYAHRLTLLFYCFYYVLMAAPDPQTLAALGPANAGAAIKQNIVP